jgi:predicted nucleic acid-binding protein
MVVLDANIPIRAVLGRRVREILEDHFTSTRFFVPDTAIAEAREHLPEILLKRGVNPESAMVVLDELPDLIGCIDDEVYGRFEKTARRRLQRRDEEDWSVLATALALECPIRKIRLLRRGYRNVDYGSRGIVASRVACECRWRIR